jgi:hypothetical protein
MAADMPLGSGHVAVGEVITAAEAAAAARASLAEAALHSRQGGGWKSNPAPSHATGAGEHNEVGAQSGLGSLLGASDSSSSPPTSAEMLCFPSAARQHNGPVWSPPKVEQLPPQLPLPAAAQSSR